MSLIEIHYQIIIIFLLWWWESWDGESYQRLAKIDAPTPNTKSAIAARSAKIVRRPFRGGTVPSVLRICSTRTKPVKLNTTIEDNKILKSDTIRIL